jgi:membrane glycosyltransferase
MADINLEKIKKIQIKALKFTKVVFGVVGILVIILGLIQIISTWAVKSMLSIDGLINIGQGLLVLFISLKVIDFIITKKLAKL